MQVLDDYRCDGCKLVSKEAPPAKDGEGTSADDGAAPTVQVRKQLLVGEPPRVLILTWGTQTATAGALSDAVHGGAWGCARVLRLEHAALRVLSAEADRGVRAASAGCASLVEAANDGPDVEHLDRAQAEGGFGAFLKARDEPFLPEPFGPRSKPRD